jgi:hypothetical protein
LINTAIVDAARRDWQTRPLSDYNCLARHGVSADQLASRGIGPDDPRVRQILSQCAVAAPAPVTRQPTATRAEEGSPVYYVANTTPPDAFLALRTDPAMDLKFAPDRQWIACETGHLDLLSRRDVYERMAGWVAQK